MKIIIYAVGGTFEQHRHQLNWDEIVALSDKKELSVAEINGKPVISPQEIEDCKYDVVAVFSDRLFESIRRELAGEYNVPKDKIVPWREIIPDESKAMHTMLPMIAMLCQERDCKNILDIGMTVIPKRCLIKEELFEDKDIVLEGLWREGAIRTENLYDKIYESGEECDKQFDAILLWNETECMESVVDSIKDKTKYILISMRYLKEGRNARGNLKHKLEHFGKVTVISVLEGIIWIIDTKHKVEDLDISIYVVTHRKYNCYTNDIYKKLCVGNFEEKGCLTEKKGNNISYLNKKINECTALYWIWKNTDSKYVGLNHYRRYFYNNAITSIDNYLDAEHIAAFLDKYDIILPNTNPMDQMSVYEQIEKSINHELFKEGYRLLRNKIEKQQPDYLEAFESVLNRNNAFLYNLFVTKREILNQYCEWLFSFLTEAATEINVEGYDSYSQRVIGFFAERMWTVWLQKNKLRIKELPCVLL